MENKNGIKIFSVSAAHVYCVDNDIKLLDKEGNLFESKKHKRKKMKAGEPYYNWKTATLPESLFLDYMRDKLTIDERGFCKDFIKVDFNYSADVKNLDGINEGKKGMHHNKLRELYYEEGIYIKIPKSKKRVHYKMLYRTAGAAKEGSVIFIRSQLYKKAHSYLTMGLIKNLPAKNVDIVGLSAYQSLVTGAAIDYMHIPWENILVIEDETVMSDRGCWSVKVKNEDYKKLGIDYKQLEDEIRKSSHTFYKSKQKSNPDLQVISKSVEALKDFGYEKDSLPKKEYTYTDRKCFVDRSMTDHAKNVVWDGQGLIDESIFPESMDGFVYCRNHFFKACLFRCNIQGYFKDKFKEKYETATVEDMFGNRIYVKDIKVITTNNAIKWLKFNKYMGNNPYRTYKNWLKKYNNKFAIIKTGHPSKYGDLQRTSYQMVNSLPTTDEEVISQILSPSVEYINQLKTNKDAFVQHLKVTSSPYKINEVLIALNEMNEDFQYSKFFKDNREDIISKFKCDRMLEGKLLLPGDNLTLCGNPIALLMKAVGEKYKQEGCFEVKNDAVQCYTTRFTFGEKLAGFRNPHNAPNNIVCFENIECPQVAKYLPNIGKNVIIVNGIGTDVQARLNGMDFDSDTVFVTNQEQMVKLAAEAYENHPTVINGIKENAATSYDMDMLSYAKMDNKIQSAQISIGKSSNLAQVALSHFYNSGMSENELEDVFIIGAVLAQCSIDSAKRTFEIGINKEISRLCKSKCLPVKDEKIIYPEFFYKIVKKEQKQTEDEEDEKIVPQKLNCPMDKLSDVIEKCGVIDLRKHPNLKTKTLDNEKFMMLIDSCEDSKFHDKVFKLIKDGYDEIDKLKDEQKDEKTVVFNEMVRKTSSMIRSRKNIQQKDMLLFVNGALKKSGNYTKLRNHLLTTLYAADKEKFLNCFLSTQSEQKVA